ncbi:cyclic nucleotide-binding domain-containing protein [Brevundimonas sp. NPDC055814]|uniref:cyclic nucleotide-binding domain-containing protein n=1 Tax=Brevundimonas TaxID=41275 RepID=UPI002F35B0AA
MLHLPPTRRLELKLARRDCLTAQESAALAGLVEEPVLKPAGAQLVGPGERPEISTLLLSGFAARYSELADGRRQYTQVNCPGDFVDLHSLVMRQTDHGVLGLSPCVVSAVPHDRLRRITEDRRRRRLRPADPTAGSGGFSGHVRGASQPHLADFARHGLD